MCDEQIVCELCGGRANLTEHHLTPRQKGGGPSRTKNGEKCPKAWLCRACHNQVHALLTNRELKMNYNTIEKLKVHPEIIKFVEWFKKRRPKHVRYHGKELKKR